MMKQYHRTMKMARTGLKSIWSLIPDLNSDDQSIAINDYVNTLSSKDKTVLERILADSTCIFVDYETLLRTMVDLGINYNLAPRLKNIDPNNILRILHPDGQYLMPDLLEKSDKNIHISPLYLQKWVEEKDGQLIIEIMVSHKLSMNLDDHPYKLYEWLKCQNDKSIILFVNEYGGSGDLFDKYFKGCISNIAAGGNTVDRWTIGGKPRPVLIEYLKKIHNLTEREIAQAADIF